MDRVTAAREPRPFTTLEDIRDWIESSKPADWEVGHPLKDDSFRLGPLLLTELAGPSPHHLRAVYLPRRPVRLCWGRERGRAYEPAWQPPAWGPAKPRLAELFWKGMTETVGTSIERYRFAVVDSGRCFLPEPRRVRAVKPDGAVGAPRFAITRYERALFSLLNDLTATTASGERFDEYLRQAGIEVAG